MRGAFFLFVSMSVFMMVMHHLQQETLEYEGTRRERPPFSCFITYSSLYTIVQVC